MLVGMRLSLLLGLALLVGGCRWGMASWHERAPTGGPDGQPGWWAIRCHRDDAGCFQEMGKACPDGYAIHQQEGRKFYVIKCNGRIGPADD